MELLGRESAGVVSVSCSATSDTAFATLTNQGALTLWDVRLPRRSYMTLRNPNPATGAEAAELRFLPERHAAIALCGDTVQLFDTRRGVSVAATYRHDKECVAFLRNAPPTGATTTLIIDDDGGIFAYNFTDGSRPPLVEGYVFGQRSTPLPRGSTFGHLSNYCSGLHAIEVAGDGGDEEAAAARVLLAVGMDGEGALYSRADDGDRLSRLPFSVAQAPQGRGTAQMVNPPLVNCTAVCQTQMAVGRADGMYAVYDVERAGLDEAMSSPGHAVNGLCYVDWVSPGVLLTASLCGDITGWAVGAFMCPDDEEDDAGADGPAAVAALAHREVPGCEAGTVNCADLLAAQRYVFGDHLGAITLAPLEL